MGQDRSYFFVVTPDKSRFLAGDIPTENTFRELLSSIAFRTVQGDQATSQQRGLVRFATPAEVEAFRDGGVNGDMLTVGPDQLPLVQAGDSNIHIDYVFSGKKWVFKVSVDTSELPAIPRVIGAWVPILAAGEATKPRFNAGWVGLTVGTFASAYRDLGDSLIELNIYAQSTGSTKIMLLLPSAIQPARVVYNSISMQLPGGPPSTTVSDNLVITATGDCEGHIVASDISTGVTVLAHIIYQKD